MAIARYYSARQDPSRHALLNLELRLAFLLNEMLSLSTDEAIDRGLEPEIWQPIPAPSDEQLEILTQIRIGRSWRVHARRAIIRRARSIRSRSRVIRNEFVVTGRRPYPRLFWELRQLLEALCGIWKSCE
ncbi:hypothetical protein N7534_003752 [Penicillium rubens]|nr:hypothetical protein N7534_003752 [Penicillium rubens]